MGKWWSVGRRAKRGLFSKEKILKRETWENDFFGGDFNLVIIRRERVGELLRKAKKAISICVSAQECFFILFLFNIII